MDAKREHASPRATHDPPFAGLGEALVQGGARADGKARVARKRAKLGDEEGVLSERDAAGVLEACGDGRELELSVLVAGELESSDGSLAEGHVSGRRCPENDIHRVAGQPERRSHGRAADDPRLRILGVRDVPLGNRRRQERDSDRQCDAEVARGRHANARWAAAAGRSRLA